MGRRGHGTPGRPDWLGHLAELHPLPELKQGGPERVVKGLGILLGDLHEDILDGPGLWAGDDAQELGDVGNPRPCGDAIGVGFKGLLELTLGILGGEEPEDAGKELLGFLLVLRGGRVEVAVHSVRPPVGLPAIPEELVLVITPVGPGLAQGVADLHGGGKSLVGIVQEVLPVAAHGGELVEEEALEGEELGLLVTLEVAEVGAVDGFQPQGNVLAGLQIALGFLPQLQEGVLDFNVREAVDLGEGAEAHLDQAVFPGHVGEAVDAPGSLVEAEESERILVWQQKKGLNKGNRNGKEKASKKEEEETHPRFWCPKGLEGGVDGGEDMLPPGKEVVPHVDIIPLIREALPPGAENSLELLDELAPRGLVTRGEASQDLLRFLKLRELLEHVKQPNVGVGNDLGEVVPLVEEPAGALLQDLLDVRGSDGLLVGQGTLGRGLEPSHLRVLDLELAQTKVGLVELDLGIAGIRVGLLVLLQRRGVRTPIRQLPGTEKKNRRKKRLTN